MLEGQLVSLREVSPSISLESPGAWVVGLECVCSSNCGHSGDPLMFRLGLDFPQTKTDADRGIGHRGIAQGRAVKGWMYMSTLKKRVETLVCGFSFGRLAPKQFPHGHGFRCGATQSALAGGHSKKPADHLCSAQLATLAARGNMR